MDPNHSPHAQQARAPVTATNYLHMCLFCQIHLTLEVVWCLKIAARVTQEELHKIFVFPSCRNSTSLVFFFLKSTVLNPRWRSGGFFVCLFVLFCIECYRFIFKAAELLRFQVRNLGGSILRTSRVICFQSAEIWPDQLSLFEDTDTVLAIGKFICDEVEVNYFIVFWRAPS